MRIYTQFFHNVYSPWTFRRLLVFPLLLCLAVPLPAQHSIHTRAWLDGFGYGYITGREEGWVCTHGSLKFIFGDSWSTWWCFCTITLSRGICTLTLVCDYEWKILCSTAELVSPEAFVWGVLWPRWISLPWSSTLEVLVLCALERRHQVTLTKITQVIQIWQPLSCITSCLVTTPQPSCSTSSPASC